MFERLDRALGNEDWAQEFPHSLISYLSRIKSDHRSLLLSLNPKVSLPRGRPFRLMVGWVEHLEFDDFMFDKGAFNGNMVVSFDKLTHNLKILNKEVYGHISSRKKTLTNNLEEGTKEDGCFEVELACTG